MQFRYKYENNDKIETVDVSLLHEDKQEEIRRLVFLDKEAIIETIFTEDTIKIILGESIKYGLDGFNVLNYSPFVVKKNDNDDELNLYILGCDWDDAIQLWVKRLMSTQVGVISVYPVRAVKAEKGGEVFQTTKAAWLGDTPPVFSVTLKNHIVLDNNYLGRSADLLKDLCERKNIDPGQVTLHSDNGSPMKGATMLAMMQVLGVITSFSRPRVSDDAPYSKSLFKTLKYVPEYPGHFDSIEAAREYMERFTQWYNEEHYHSGIKYVTPAQRRRGEDAEMLIKRKAVYEKAKARHPERWSGETRNWDRIDIVHLNPVKEKLNKVTLAEVA